MSPPNSSSTGSDAWVGAGVIWSFWEGQPPDLVLRCFESIRIHNTSRPFLVLSKATLPKFLDANTDYPLFHGRRGTPDDFSKVQYLADWVRLTLLDKYGGIWLDASVICTSAVDNWIVEHDEIIYDSDEEEEERRVAPKLNRTMINMFPMVSWNFAQWCKWKRKLSHTHADSFCYFIKACEWCENVTVVVVIIVTGVYTCVV
jgi:mannosyltransferase OCH1-like enzyme